MRTWLCLPLATTLAACNMGESVERASLSREVVPVTSPLHTSALPAAVIAAESEEERRSRAIATLVLPEAVGRVVRVRETHHTNGSRQEIVLVSDRAPGENVIDVSIRMREPDGRDYKPLMIGPPTESGVRNEILSRFPDVQMNIVTRPMRNALGPFGLAVGRHASGARCVFAWQWVDDLREVSSGSSNFLKLNAAMSGKGLAASVRVRICRNDSTVDQLAAYVEGLRAGSSEAIERIATLDRREPGSAPVLTSDASAAAGAQSSPLLRPVSGSLEAAISVPRATVATAAPRPSRMEAAPPRAVKVARREPQRAQAAPAPRRPVARPIARPVEQPPAYAQEPAPVAPAQVYGQRYLAPLSAPAPSALTMAGPPPGAASSAMNLPPQALQGPGWR